MTWAEAEEKRIANEKTIAGQMGWKYYLPEAKQTREVGQQLQEIHQQSEYKEVRDIKVIDPCMGSGHILVYAFDVLMQLYEDAGYSQRDAAQSILQNNLYGLDIDDRAAQLAYFAVMMKARQYDRRIFSRGIQPHIYAIQESNNINRAHLKYLGAGMDDLEVNTARVQLEGLLDTLRDAKEYGSILKVENHNWELLRRFVAAADAGEQISMDSAGLEVTAEQLLTLIDIAETMERKYDVVVTNPPYMGSSNMSAKLSEFVKKNYPDSKSDLFAVFIERCGQMTAKNRYQAMITQHAWMFLSSFEKLRAKLLLRDAVNMAHLGPRAFEEIGGEVVQTTSFVLRNSHLADYKGTYCRLIEPTTQQGKEEMFLAGENRYTAQQSNFSKIPGSPVAYWVSKKIANLFTYPLSDTVIALREGIHTGKNEMFLREWFEVSYNLIVFNASGFDDVDRQGRWVPYSKGGTARKWYGNNELVIGFDDIYRRKMSTMPGHVRPSQKLYFKEGATWSALSSGFFALRMQPAGHLFDSKGQVAIGEKYKEIMGLFNTKVYQQLADILMPTLDYKVWRCKKKLPYCHVK